MTSILGIYGLRANPRNPINKANALFMWSITLYLFSNLEGLSYHSLRFNLFWDRFSCVLAFFIITCFVYFSSVFPTPKPFAKNRFLIFIPSLFFLFLIGNDYLISSYCFQYDEKIIIYGSVFPFFLLCFLIYLFIGIINLIKTYRESETILLRTQVEYVLTGIFTGGILGIFAHIIFPLFSIPQVPSLPLFSSIILASFTTYALIKQRPLDIEVILKKSIFYYLLTILVIGIYILGVMNLGIFLKRLIGSTSIIIESLLIVAIAFAFKPVADGIEFFINTKLFPKYFSHQKILQDFSKSLMYYIDLDRLVKLLLDTVRDALQIEKICIFLQNEKKTFLEVRETRGISEQEIYSFKIEINHPLFKFLSKNPKVWEIDRLKEIKSKDAEDVLSKIKRFGFYFCIPLFMKDNIIGLFTFGEKIIGTTISAEELELLSALANQVSIAIENALVYEDLKETYKRLSQAEKLAALGEFSASLAHEIKNPLSNIKGSAEILKKSDKKEEQKKFIEYIIEEVNRLNTLVNEFLQFARPRELKLRKVNINELIDKSLFSLNINLSDFNIIKDYQEDLSEIEVDLELMQQAFLNLLINANESMDGKGEIYISTRIIENNKLQIKFRDRGSGISKENLDRVFDPFFTTKGKGTGLGLAIVYKIIKLHNGEIFIESSTEEKKGTTVTINLPQSS